MSALPGSSDINLFRYCQSVIDFDAKIPDRAFDLGMTEQELDSPQIACPSIDQGRFGAAQGMRPKQPRVETDAADRREFIKLIGFAAVTQAPGG